MFKTPLLVDIKITGHCHYGCSWCYSSSTTAGKHADTETLLQIFKILGDLKVFEVAFGGGEPINHPDIADLLAGARAAGPIPNLTTYKLNWVSNEKLGTAIKNYVGGIALSVNNNFWEARKKIPAFSMLRELLDMEQWNSGKRLTVQTIIGVMSEKDLLATMDLTKDYVRRLTLLGYKDYGFGKSAYPRRESIDIKRIYRFAKEKYLSLDLDTLAVQQFKQELQELGVPEEMMSTKEGHSSMYIDAVDMKIARDSYTDDKVEFTLDNLKEQILEHFPYE